MLDYVSDTMAHEIIHIHHVSIVHHTMLCPIFDDTDVPQSTTPKASAPPHFTPNIAPHHEGDGHPRSEIRTVRSARSCRPYDPRSPAKSAWMTHDSHDVIMMYLGDMGSQYIFLHKWFTKSFLQKKCDPIASHSTEQQLKWPPAFRQVLFCSKITQLNSQLVLAAKGAYGRQ